MGGFEGVFTQTVNRRIENPQRAGRESQLLKRFPGMTKRDHVNEEKMGFFFPFFFI